MVANPHDRSNFFSRPWALPYLADLAIREAFSRWNNSPAGAAEKGNGGGEFIVHARLPCSQIRFCMSERLPHSIHANIHLFFPELYDLPQPEVRMLTQHGRRSKLRSLNVMDLVVRRLP